MKNGREYLRAGEIARLTGVSIRTVRRWIKNEVLLSIKIGGARLVAAAELEGLLSASDHAPQESPAGQEEDCDESDH